MKYDKHILGKNIKKERENRKLTQKQLGDLIPISGKQISLIESGKTEHFPSLDILSKLCDIFNCELGYLLGEESYAETNKLYTEINKRTGLTKESIDELINFTDIFGDSLLIDNKCLVLNKLLSDKDFYQSLDYLVSYHHYRSENESLEKEILNKYSSAQLDTAFYFINDAVPNIDPPPSEVESTIINEVYHKQETIERNEQLMRMNRFEAIDAFSRVIHKLFPCSEDTIY